MTTTLAREIADEQIAWWQREGVTATQAWSSIFGPVWCVEWWEVRGRMIRLLLNSAAPQRRAA